MNCTTPFASLSILLSGIRWHIHAEDAGASLVVTALGEAMSLPPTDSPAKPYPGGQCKNIRVMVGPEPGRFSSGGYKSGQIHCLLPPPRNNDMLVLGMSFIALAIARAELSRGGLLVHGALAQPPLPSKGGIILTGPGTVGKTTACHRLPPPWRSLSDDSSLVVRDDRGQYMAHPWPTWSRLHTTSEHKQGPGGRWNVQNGIPLQAFFFLAQAQENRIAPLSPTPAVAYLMETVQHVSSLMRRDLPLDEARALYANQLAAAEELVRTIPAHTLHLNLTGPFWEQIEETLAANSSAPLVAPEQILFQESTQNEKQSTSPPLLFGENRLAVSYYGSSMHPTLRHPDLMEIIPYEDKPIRRGDVIYFHPPTKGPRLIHRVVQVTAKGSISTRGDNTFTVDPFLLHPSDIIGQITAAWRHGRRRSIAGGLRGIWTGYRAGIYRRLNHFFAPLLHGIYHGLAASGFIRAFLPASLRPRVIQFHQRHLPPILKLIRNGQVIGHYDVWQEHWFIDRPWKLILDEQRLPRSPGVPSLRTPPFHNAEVKNTTPENN